MMNEAVTFSLRQCSSFAWYTLPDDHRGPHDAWVESITISANESSAVASVRTINTAEVTYNSTYPTIGFSPDLVSLGGALGAACTPSSTTACLIDSVLANNGNPAGNGKSGYSFVTGTGTVAGQVNVGYTVQATPLTINQTGIRGFCAEEDSVVRVDPAGKCSNTEAGVLTFNPLNQ